MELKKMSLLDYTLLPGPIWRPGLAEYYVNMNSSVIYGLKQDGRILAYAVVLTDRCPPILAYVFSDPERRRRGLAGCLIRAVAAELGSDLECRMTRLNKYYAAIHGLMLKLGASASLINRVYSVVINDRLWARMDELKMEKMKALVLRGGGKCCSLRQAEPDIMDQLYDSRISSFKNQLDPGLFRNDPHVDPDISTVMIRGSRLCAYTLITRQGDDAVCVEQISESSETIGTGMVIAPLCTTLQSIRSATPAFSRMSLAIMHDNFASASFVMSILHDRDLQIKDNYSYIIHAVR